MNLFFYKPTLFNPILFLIAKISNKDDMEILEAYTNEIFQILIDEKEATEKNILIFSVIKDYEKTTQNLILPSTKSNKKLTERCYNETKFVNSLVVETLKNTDSKFHIEITPSKIFIHNINLNLMSLSKFYTI